MRTSPEGRYVLIGVRKILEPVFRDKVSMKAFTRYIVAHKSLMSNHYLHFHGPVRHLHRYHIAPRPISKMLILLAQLHVVLPAWNNIGERNRALRAKELMKECLSPLLCIQKQSHGRSRKHAHCPVSELLYQRMKENLKLGYPLASSQMRYLSVSSHVKVMPVSSMTNVGGTGFTGISGRDASELTRSQR